MSIGLEMTENGEMKSLIERLASGEEIPIYDPEAGPEGHNRSVRLTPVERLAPLEPKMQAILASDLKETAKIFNGCLPAVGANGALYPMRLTDVLQNMGVRDMLVSSIPG